MVGIDAISRFGFADVVPIGGRVSFGEIAKATGLDEPLVRRLLRHAMARHIFYEPEPGMVAHTKMSKYFVEPSMKDFLGFGAREGWPAATRVQFSAINLRETYCVDGLTWDIYRRC